MARFLLLATTTAKFLSRSIQYKHPCWFLRFLFHFEQDCNSSCKQNQNDRYTNQNLLYIFCQSNNTEQIVQTWNPNRKRNQFNSNCSNNSHFPVFFFFNTYSKKNSCTPNENNSQNHWN